MRHSLTREEWFRIRQLLDAEHRRLRTNAACYRIETKKRCHDDRCTELRDRVAEALDDLTKEYDQLRDVVLRNEQESPLL